MSRGDVPDDVAAIRGELETFLNKKDTDGRIVGNSKYGVYAFYDYDGEPIYVGQTVEKLRVRIRRHLTNQRTDAVAMKVLDPFEVAEIEMWPFFDLASDDVRETLDAAEFTVYEKVLSESSFRAVLNEKGIPKTRKLKLPPSVRGGIIPKGIYAARKHADVRIARRASTITEQRYRFWVQGPLPGQNEIVKAAKGFGGRGYGYSRLKKAWTQSIAWLVKAARIPPLKRVRLEFERVHANRRRDKDNVEGGGAKLAWDSLVVAGVLKNDGWKQNAGSTHTHTLGPKPGVWITVIPVAASNSRLGSSSTPPR